VKVIVAYLTCMSHTSLAFRCDELQTGRQIDCKDKRTDSL